MEPTIPIAALGERQVWRDASLWIAAEHHVDRLHVRLAIDGHYGDEMPPEDWQQAGFEHACAGFDCVIVDWPTWSMPPDAWPTVVARMDAKLWRRAFLYERPDPTLASLLVAELHGRWQAFVQWQPSPGNHIRFDIDRRGHFTVSPCDDAVLASLRAHTGLPTGDRVDRTQALAVLERAANWWPATLSLVRAEIDHALDHVPDV